MVITILRDYYPTGVNGEIWHNETLLCYCIELPWKDNARSISCIPEGRYPLVKRYSERFKDHLLVKNVSNRSLILLHPANIALSQLRGCISPVVKLTGIGVGIQSKIALKRVLDLVEVEFAAGKEVWLEVKKRI